MITDIIPVGIPPIDQTIEEYATGSGETLYARCKILSKDIVIDAARSAVCVLRNLADVMRHGMDRTTPQDRNTAIGSTTLASTVRIGGSTTGSPISTGNQDIISPRGSNGAQWSREAQPLDTFINGICSKHRDTVPTWSKAIGFKLTD